MCKSPEINKFDDLTNFRAYIAMKKEIGLFITKTIEEFKPDIVITVERKGRRIFHDVIGSSDTGHYGFTLKTDSEFIQNDVIEKSALIFDDSMKNADSVRKIITDMGAAKPKRLKICTILSNNNAISNLEDAGVKKGDIAVMKQFSDYDEQENEYVCSIFPLLSGVDNKLGADYPTVTIETDYTVQNAEKIITDAMCDLGYHVEKFQCEAVTQKKNCEFTAYHDIEDSIIFNGYAYEELKVRFSITNSESVTRITFEPIQFPSELNRMMDECDKNDVKNKFCSIMGLKPNDELCRKCMTLDMSLKHMDYVITNVLQRIGPMTIKRGWVTPPFREKYPAKVIRNWDVFQR